MLKTLNDFLHQPVDASRGPAPAEPPPDVQAEAPGVDEPSQAFALPISDQLKPLVQATDSLRGAGLLIGQVLDQLREIYQAPYVQVAPLSSAPFVVRLHGRYYSLIFSQNATNTINMYVPGVGTVSNFALTTGWNRLYLPEGAEITANTPTQFTVLFMATNNFN